eukprot:16440492-Heterocapsa_arctica.AAC.1
MSASPVAVLLDRAQNRDQAEGQSCPASRCSCFWGSGIAVPGAFAALAAIGSVVAPAARQRHVVVCATDAPCSPAAVTVTAA